MANVLAIKDFLCEDKERIIAVLEKIGCEQIKYYPSSNEIRCAETSEGNPTAVRIKCDTLLFKNYRDGSKGDIFSLLQKNYFCTFPEALNIIQKIFKLEDIESKEIRYPFNAFYKKLIKYNSKSSGDIHIYDKNALKNITNVVNTRFLNDGISFDIQREFEVGFDIETNRITIPWFSSEGDLIGVMGRINSDNYDKELEPKYMAILPFQKTMSLYGFSHNYSNIIGGTVFIAEAEKATMQSRSVNINNVVSVGCHNISPHQVKLIRSLHPKNIIVAFDEGISEEEILQECEKFKTNNYFQYNIGYFDNTILQSGSKKSPFDMGKDMRKLLKENIKWLVS